MVGRSLGFLALGALALTSGLGQEPTFRVTVDTVPVYVSVKDGKGRPIRGLTQADFRVFEEGAAQQITHFREVEIASPESSSKAGATEASATERAGSTGDRPRPEERRYIVFRFDPLQSPRSLQRAQEAGLEALDLLNPLTDYAAVSWRNTISEFTQDRTRLELLIRELRPDLFGLSLGLNASADPERAVLAPTGGAGLEDEFEQLFPQVPDMEMLDSIVNESLQIGSRAPFLSTVGSLKYLQGKKLCFYFGQGLSVPRVDDRDKRRYDPEYTSRLFSDAGFTVFAINPLGLVARTSSPLPATGPGSGGGSMRARSERVFRMPSASGAEDVYLRRWAEKTGGFAFYNNNNLKKGVRQVFEFNQHYYLLSYRSSNQTYDARFRKLTVEVAQKQAKLSYRNGYFATAPGASELRSRTLITALMNPDVFHDFPLEVNWNQTAPDRLDVELLFPFQNIPLLEQQVLMGGRKKEERFIQEILLAALVLDEKGEPLGGLQEIFNLELQKEQVAQLRQQNASIVRSLQLTPGKPTTIKVAAIVGQNVQLSAKSVRLK